MKINELNTPVLPDTYEASMFLSQTIRAGKYAIKIHNMIDNDQEMESWVAKKLDISSSYISSVGHYLEGQGTPDNDGMSEIKKMPKGTGTMQGVKEDAGEKFVVTYKGIQKANDEDSALDILQDNGYDIERNPDGTFLVSYQGVQKADNIYDVLDILRDEGYDVQTEGEFSEDAGEGHMAKSQMYKIAKYCLKISTLVKPGDDIEAWVQTKMNRAVDMLDAVYHYEDYQIQNPYREELEQNVLQKHSHVVQKNIDEILARETPAHDIETKPGMLNILKKRVQEVEKKMCKEKTESISKEGVQQGFAVRYSRDGKRLVQAYKTKDSAKKRENELKNIDGVKNISITQHTLNFKENDVLDEGIKDWVKKLAAAGVIVGAVAGIGSINNAIDNSVPAIQAMNTAYEMAVDAGNSELASMIEKDISSAKLRLSSGKDLNHIKHLQDKYSKFMSNESVTRESNTVLYTNKLTDIMGKKLGETWTNEFKKSLKS